MTRNELQRQIRMLGGEMTIGADNLHAAAEQIRNHPDDLRMAIAHLTVGSGCIGTQRQLFLALLNRTDPSDCDVAALHLLAGDFDRVVHDGNNLAVAAGKCQLGQPGYTLADLRRAVDALDRLAGELRQRLIGFSFQHNLIQEPVHA